MFLNWILYLATIVTSSLGEMPTEKNTTKTLGPPCENEKMFRPLVHYKISSPEDIILLALDGSNPGFCRDLTVENERVEEYLKHCDPTAEQGLYLGLLSGLKTVKSKICDDSNFKELFDRNQRCYNIMKYEVMSCIGPEDWIERKNTTEVCGIMKSIIGCHYTKTLVNCNVFAAEVLNQLMRNIMSSVKEMHCKNIVQDTYVRDLRSIATGSSGKLVPEILTVVILALALLCFENKTPYDL